MPGSLCYSPVAAWDLWAMIYKRRYPAAARKLTCSFLSSMSGATLSNKDGSLCMATTWTAAARVAHSLSCIAA